MAEAIAIEEIIAVAVILIGFAFSHPAIADQQTFDEGAAFARDRANAATGNVTNEGTAQTNVPNYSNNPSESVYFNQGAGAADAGAAASTTSDSAQTVNRSNQNADRINIDPNTDPMLTRGQEIIRNPITAQGGIGSTYSGCSTPTQGTTSQTQNVQCREYRDNQTFNCEENLVVDVTPLPSCQFGQWYASSTAYRNGSDQMHAQAMCESRTDNLVRQRFYAHGGEGGCVGWQEVYVDVNNFAWQRAGDARPHWNGGCWPGWADYRSLGCSGYNCSTQWRFRFGYCSPYTVCDYDEWGYPYNCRTEEWCDLYGEWYLTLSFERGHTNYSVADRREGTCGGYASRVR